MTAPDAITFARAADGRTTLAKILKVEGGKIVGKEPSPNVKTFKYAARPVHDLGSLYITVRRMAARGAIAVRAKPKGPLGNRRIHETDGIEPHLVVVPRRWCAFDWDGLPLDLQPCRTPSGHGSLTHCSSRGSALRSRFGACRQRSAMCRASGR